MVPHAVDWRTSPGAQWDADTVLVVGWSRVLTTGDVAGKKRAACRSEQGMTAHLSRTGTSPARREGGDAADVVAWRERRLRDAGFPTHLARTLAGQHVDLHSVLQLVDRGCPPDLAARILAPADPAEASWTA